MDASNKQETAAEKFARVWEKKNSKAARAGGVSLMALSLAACGSSSTTTTTDSGSTGSTGSTTTATAQSYNLTDEANDIEGGSGNDTITGAVNTVSASDYIVGGAGTDTLTVRMDADDAFGVIDGVENIVVYARGDNNAAPLSFVDVSGATNVTFKNGNTNFDVADFSTAISLKIENTDDEYTIAYTDLTGDEDSQALTVDGYEGNLVIGTTGLETLAVTLSGAESTFSVQDHGTATIETITVAGAVDGSIELNAATDAVTSISAASATGAVTMDVDALDLDLTLTGGTGGDTFTMGQRLNTGDTVVGGAGSDELTATLATATTVRPTISETELLDLDFTAAATLDLRNSTGINAVELEYSAAPTISNAAATLTSITIDEATANTANLSVDYAASSDSAVTITVAGSDTDADNDVAVSVGDITVTDNAGALTVTSGGEADNSIDAFTADDVAAVTFDAATMGLTQTGAFSAAGATAATFNATADDLSVGVGSGVTLTDAESVTLAAIGGSLTSTLITTAADSTITVTAAGSDDNDVSASLDADHFTTITLTATGGADITLSAITFEGENAAADDIDTSIVASAEADSVITISDLIEETDGTDATLDLVVVTGAGEFSLTADDDEIIVTEIDATGHSGVLTIDLGTNVDQAVEVNVGSGADHATGEQNTITTGSAADIIVGGAGVDDITGGAGADDITLGGGADVVVLTEATAMDTIQDFVVGADGDVIEITVAAAAIGSSILQDGDSANITAGDAVVLKAVAGATALAAGDNIMVIDGDFSTAAAMADALEGGAARELTFNSNNTANDDFIIVYDDGSDTFIAAVNAADAAATITTATVTNLVQLIGIDDATTLTADNFAFV